jgi:glycerol-3-phosphate acyltransferase PlsY
MTWSAILQLFSLVPFYLLGTFPTGPLIAKRAGVDLRAHGSGNIGTTNAMRILGKKAGLLTLLGDAGKGALAVLSGLALNNDPLYGSLCALAVVAGHCFSLPQISPDGRWHGGKGVATSVGALLALNPFSGLFGIAVFALVLMLKGIVSLASVTAAGLIPLFFIFVDPSQAVYGVILMSFLVIFKHRANLQRLSEGKEPRYSFSKKNEH